MVSIVKKGYCANKRIIVEEVSYDKKVVGGTGRYLGWNYAVTGGGWKLGNLHSEDTSPEECWDKAVREVRKEHPRSPIRVTVDLVKTEGRVVGGLNLRNMVEIKDGYGGVLYVDYDRVKKKGSPKNSDRFAVYTEASTFYGFMTQQQVMRWIKAGRDKESIGKINEAVREASGAADFPESSSGPGR